MNAVVETDRLILRPFEPADFETYFARVLGDADVMRYLATGAPMDKAEALTRFQQRLAAPPAELHAVWAVVERLSGELIGHAALHALEGTELVEVAYALGKRWWGRGYASEAASAAVRYGFERLALDPIVAVTRPTNAASRRVLQKLGFSYVRDAVFYNGPAAYYELHKQDVAPAIR